MLKVEEIDVAERQSIRIEMELYLTNADKVVVWRRRVDAYGDTSTEEVAVIVETMNSALATALEPVRGEIAGALRALGSDG